MLCEIMSHVMWGYKYTPLKDFLHENQSAYVAFSLLPTFALEADLKAVFTFPSGPSLRTVFILIKICSSENPSVVAS